MWFTFWRFAFWLLSIPLQTSIKVEATLQGELVWTSQDRHRIDLYFQTSLWCKSLTSEFHLVLTLTQRRLMTLHQRCEIHVRSICIFKFLQRHFDINYWRQIDVAFWRWNNVVWWCCISVVESTSDRFAFSTFLQGHFHVEPDVVSTLYRRLFAHWDIGL